MRHGETKGLLTHDDTCFGGKGWKAPPQGGKPPPRWAPLKAGGMIELLLSDIMNL